MSKLDRTYFADGSGSEPPKETAPDSAISQPTFSEVFKVNQSTTFDDDVDDVWGESAPPTPTAGEPEAARAIAVAVSANAWDNHPEHRSLDVDALEELCCDAVETALVRFTANNVREHDEAEKTKGRAILPARFSGSGRSDVDVDALSAFIVDLDGVPPAVVEAVFACLVALGVRFWAWTTWGHGWKKPGESWRIVVPLSVDVPASLWRFSDDDGAAGVWGMLSRALAPLNDKTTRTLSRLHFLARVPDHVPDGDGSVRANARPLWRTHSGKLLDPAPYVVAAAAEFEARHKARQAAKVASEQVEQARQRVEAPPPSPSSSKRPDLLTRAHLRSLTWDPAVEGTGTGQGSDTTLRAASELVNGFGLDDDDAFDVLSRWNKRCVPPWPHHLLRRKISVARKKGPPRGKLPNWLADEERLRVEPSTMVAANDDVDPEAAAWQAEMDEARDDLQLAMGTSAAALSKPCDFVSYADLMGQHIPPMSWLIGGLITDGAIAVVSGEPKTAKTWLAIELAVSVALGDKALGEFQAHGPRPVALFLTEDHLANVRARLHGTIVGHAGDHADGEIPIHVKARGSLDLSNIGTLAWLVASARKLPSPPALLVIDPLRNVMGKLKESDNDDMAEVNKALRAVRDVLGSVILYVHHAGKLTEQNAARRGGQKMRGGGALHGGYDAGIHLSASTISVDGKTVMGASVEVEVKAGKSAAPFSFALNIHDDANGQCVRADWAFDGKTKAAKGTEDVADKGEVAILAVWRNARLDMRMTKTPVAVASGGRKKSRLAMVDSMVADDRLACDGKFVWPADCATRYQNGFRRSLERAWWSSGAEDLDGQPFVTAAALRSFFVECGEAPGVVDAYLAKKEKSHRRGEFIGELVALGVIKPHAALVTADHPEDEQPGWIVVDPTVGADLIKRRDGGHAHEPGGPVGEVVDVGGGPTVEVPGSREVPEVPGTAHKGQVPGSLPFRGTGLGNHSEPPQSGELGNRPTLPSVGKKPTPEVEWGG